MEYDNETHRLLHSRKQEPRRHKAYMVIIIGSDGNEIPYQVTWLRASANLIAEAYNEGHERLVARVVELSSE